MSRFDHMTFEASLQAVLDRNSRYEATGDSTAVLGREALDDASRLWEAATTPDGLPEQDTAARMVAAALAIGRLHFRRSGAGEPLDYPELARALGFLRPTVRAGAETMIPQQLRLVLGSTADPGTQVGVGAELLAFATGGHHPAVLDAAINLFSDAGSGPADDTVRVQALGNLCFALRVRFERADDLADLTAAANAGEEAVRLAESPEDTVRVLTNLAGSYLARYESTGDTTDLERSIERSETAVRLCAPKTAPPHTLSNLGNAYRDVFDRTNAIDDLNRALTAAEQAISAAESDPDLRTFLHSGSITHRVAYNRTDTASHIHRAVELARAALAATPDDHPQHPAVLTDLGKVLRTRFAATDDVADLDEALEMALSAVHASSEDDPSIATTLHTACLMSLGKYDQSGERRFLDLANECSDLALDFSTDSDADRIRMIAGLAAVYDRTEPGGVDVHRIGALAERLAAATAPVPPAVHCRAAFLVGRLANSAGLHAAAASLLDQAIGLLPSIAPRESDWQDQEHSIEGYSGLVAEAVSAHCALGDPEAAVRAAERGRAVLLATRAQLRDPLTKLHAEHPALARRFADVRKMVEADPTPDETRGRRRLWATHDRLLVEIRELEGFTDFLTPPSTANLAQAVSGGFAVLVNAARQRGDAVIVAPDGTHIHVPLPELRLEDTAAHAARLLTAARDASSLSGRLRLRSVTPDLLSWLWDTVVAPVVAALPTATPPTRIWWSPVGVLSLLPLHAAGHPDQLGALDLLVSSYTATLGTLARARRSAAADRRQLIVAVEHLEEAALADLPETVVEAEALRVPEARFLANADATEASVVAALRESTWAHFACHASIDVDSPSRSGLHLVDGTVTMERISALHLVNAELAYLSACSTAVPGWQHIDESIHLASAFHLAGFRHVVASLWTLPDDVAALAARAFYQRLEDLDGAAHTLREVVLALRETDPDSPHRWAPLVHSGT